MTSSRTVGTSAPVVRPTAMSIAVACLFAIAPTWTSGASAQDAASGQAPAEPASATADDTPAPAEPAAAAEDVFGIQEIVVTAQRREQSQQDVPVAVSALNAYSLEQMGIDSVSDLAATAMPGLTVIPFAGSPSALSFNMRGVSTSDPTAGLYDPGVAVYSEGIPMGRAVGLGLDLVDLERVEILRGPQGTLFGRNAEGGAVQYVAKKPSGQFGAKVEGTLGNYDARKLVAHVDLPSFANVAIKLSGLTSQHGGYTDNRELGPNDTASHNKDFGEWNQDGFRLAARWNPSDAFEASYAFDIAKLDYTVAYTQRTGGRTPSEPAFCRVPDFAPYCATPDSIAANIYTGTQQPQHGRVDDAPGPLYLDDNDDKVNGHALTLDWKLSPAAQLKSITGYRETKSHLNNQLGTALAFVQFLPTSAFDGEGVDDVPAGTLGAVSGTTPFATIDQHQFSQELQLTGSVERVQYTTGLFYFREKLRDTRESLFSLSYVYLGEPGVLTPFAVDPFSLSPSRQVFDAEAESYAAYAQATYTPPILDAHLALTGGLRYTHDEKKHERLVFLSAPDDARAPDFKENRVDPAVTVAYQVTDDVNTYVRYATAYRAGGVSIRNKVALRTYDPEEIESWEIGLKSDLLDRRARYNVALYRNKVEGAQVTTQNLGADPSSTDVVNVDGLRFWGVENELTLVPIENVLLSLAYTYQHADVPDSFTATLFSSPADTVGTPTGIGFRAANVPKHQFSVGIDWRIPLGALQLTPHVDYAYQSRYDLAPTVPPFTQPAESRLSVLNARLSLGGIRLGTGSVTLAAWGKNLTGSDEFTFTFPAPTSDFTVAGDPGGAANLLPPRTFGFDLRVEF